MQMIRTTVTLPEDFYEELRLLAYEQRRSVSSVLLEKALQKKVENFTLIQKNIDDDIAFFRKVAKMGVQIDAAKAVREERDRDNA